MAYTISPPLSCRHPLTGIPKDQGKTTVPADARTIPATARGTFHLPPAADKSVAHDFTKSRRPVKAK